MEQGSDWGSEREDRKDKGGHAGTGEAMNRRRQ